MTTTKRKKTGGRQKGTPNKVSSKLRDDVLEALSQSGGVEYLKEQAKENPTSFMSLIGRMLPKDVDVTTDGEKMVMTFNMHLDDH